MTDQVETSDVVDDVTADESDVALSAETADVADEVETSDVVDDVTADESEVTADQIEAVAASVDVVESTPEETPSAATEPAGASGDAERRSRPPGPAAIVAPNVGDLPDEIADDFVAALEHTVLEFKEGDIVEGTVVTVDSDGAMLDIGYKSEGIIPTEELSIRNNINPGEVVQVGERIEALVLNKEDEEGRLILSKKRAQYERAWDRIQQITNEGGTVRGPVIEVVKGGLIVDIGLRGFLPASLVELRRVRDLDPYVGQEIEAKVIELDRNRNNVVLSRRAYLEEEQAEQRQAFLDQLAVGEVRQGVVSSVVAFGAFVDLGGMDGLVHVSELSWQHVNHPGEVVKVGDEVTVKVLEVDLDRERISLSIKQTLEDPWVTFIRENSVGSVVEGVVTKTVPFGAFRLGGRRCRRFGARLRDRDPPGGVTRAGTFDRTACPGQGDRDGGGAPSGEPVDQAGASRLVGEARAAGAGCGSADEPPRAPSSHQTRIRARARGRAPGGQRRRLPRGDPSRAERTWDRAPLRRGPRTRRSTERVLRPMEPWWEGSE